VGVHRRHGLLRSCDTDIRTVVVQLGFDLVHFGIVVAATLAIGVVVPPMAMTVFMVSGIAKVPLGTVYKGIYPFLIGMIICVLILMFVPQISVWLPDLLINERRCVDNLGLF